MKKKLFVLVALLAFITTANAQWYVGGSVGFTSTTIDNGNSDESGSSFKIIPDIGYKFDNYLSFGLQVGYSSGVCSFGSLSVTDIKSAISTLTGAYADISNEDMKLKGFTISPYVRYTIVNFGRANLFFEGYIGYNYISADSSPSVSTDDEDYGGDEFKVNAFELGLRPGVAVQVTDKLELLCKLGAISYMSAKEKESDMKISRFGVNADTYNLLLGVSFHF